MRLWIGALLLFVVMVAPLSVLPHESWKKAFEWFKRKMGRSEKSVKPQFEIYEDTAGEYRWRLKAPNGQVIAVSDEGYKTKDGCKNGIASVKENFPNAIIQDLTKEEKT